MNKIVWNLTIDSISVELTINPPSAMASSFTPEALIGPLNEVEAKRAPKELFVSGDAGLFRGTVRVSVVGCRKPSAEGLSRAKRLARMLVERDVVVVSGLAEGIDTAAHRGAIDAGGKTVGVIGTPLDKFYPKSNTELQLLMMNEYAVVSQFPSGHPTLRSNFVRRNATMALMVSASIIVEAGDTSGALNQGWEALRLGRALFIMESVCDNPSLTWPAKMLEYGAQRLSDSNFRHCIDVLLSEAVVDVVSL